MISRFKNWRTLTAVTLIAVCTIVSSCSKDPVTPQEQAPALAWKPMASGTQLPLRSLCGLAADEVFAFGDNGIVKRFNGSGWVQGTNTVNCDFQDSWSTAAGDIYAVGRSCMLNFDGTDWTSEDPEPGKWNYDAVWGVSKDDIFLSANRILIPDLAGIIWQWDGNGWLNTGSPQSGPELSPLRDIWGSSSLDVFAVGVGGIFHFDGTDWSEMVDGVNQYFTAVWGFAPNDVFAVGSKGTILHYDGNDWVPQISGVTTDLNAVWGTGPSAIFAVGDAGVVLRYDGTEWTQMDSDTQNDLHDVWGSSSSNVFVVGNTGTIIRYAPE